MASSISEAQAELISSLSPDDIPIKLRCAICSKLAVNAFRLPCCEQAICENCQSNLPPSCPVCEHSPLSAEDCNPNKSLRTTIRVFLRTAEKKREASRPKEPAPPAPVEVPKLAESGNEPSTSLASQSLDVNGATHQQEANTRLAEDTAPENVHQTPEVDASNGDELTKQDGAGDATNSALVEGDNDEHHGANEAEGHMANETEQGDDQEGNDQENYGSESANGGMSNMMFSGSGDMNQMQMMVAMQNGMGPNSFGNFPMMGIPGMGMDPMAMQNMYMNGGFQGMGMNGMGGGFGGGFGQGSSNNNWNGSQSWNFDQNNYNQNGIGMGIGDFGNFNSGFQTGYNQGNYGQFNDYRRNNNFGRGRGRGRGYYGGYGRGGYQHNGMSSYQGQGHGQGQYSQQGSQGNLGQAQIETHGDSESGGANRPENDSRLDENHGEDEAGQEGEAANATQDQSGNLSSGDTLANEASDEAARPGGPGVIRSVFSAPDVPVNAPTGPKAMRQGLPNTSLHHLRARGFQVGNEAQHQVQSAGSQPLSGPAAETRVRSKSPDRELDQDAVHDDAHDIREQSKDHDRPEKDNLDSQPHSRNRSRSRSGRSTRTQSRSRSGSRSHKSSHRRRRQRSESVNDDGIDDSHRRKKHRSSRKHYDDDGQYHSRESKNAEMSRSASPDESKRSSHRSHRDRDYESRRGRDKDKHREDDRQKSSSHRSHRTKDHDSSRRRDRDRDRDQKDRKDRHRERDRDRDRYRDRDRDRDHRHDSTSRRGSTEGRSTPAEQSTATRGSSSRAHEKSSRDRDRTSHNSGSKPSTPVDPHTLEREARNRERLLKEAQRMAGLSSIAGSKRSRDDTSAAGDESTSRKGRRTSRRSEARDGGDEEERMRRLEAEREGGRWG